MKNYLAKILFFCTFFLSYSSLLAQNENSFSYFEPRINDANLTISSFQGGLGSFTCNTPLILNGFESKTKRCGTCEITNVSMSFRIFKVGETPGGFSEINYGQRTTETVNPTDPLCKDQVWSNTGHNANLLNGLSNGTYTLELFFKSTGNNCQPNDLTTATFSSNFTYYNNPTITVQPLDLVNCTGLDMFFKTNATGIGLLSYKWQRSDNGGSFTDLTATTRYVDVTTKTLKINNIITDNHDDLFRCVITDAANGCSTTTRAAAALVSRKSTVVSTANTVCEGDSNLLTSSILAGTVASYQWQYRVGTSSTYNNLTENTIFVNTQTSVLKVRQMPLEISRYRVEIFFNTTEMDDFGNAISGTCRLTENENFVVKPRPTKPAAIDAVARCGSGTVSFESPQIYNAYRWYADTTQTNLATTKTFSPMVSATKKYFFGYLSADGCESFRSETQATVHPVPSITLGSVTALCPETTTFSLPFSNAQNANQYSLTSTTNGFVSVVNAMLPASSITVTIPPTLAAGTHNFALKVRNSTTLCESDDIPFAITIKQPTEILTNPAAQTVCLETPVTMQITASGAGTLTYQWLKNESIISGKNSASLSFPSVESTDGGNYSCQVTGECGTKTSTSALLTVKAKTTISQHPQNTTKCEGETVTFTVNATGDGTLRYQWKKNEINIGIDNNSLTINNLSNADNNAKITCDISADCGITTTDAATLTIVALPAAPTVTTPIGYCKSSATMPLTANQATGNTLFWWGTNATSGSSSPNAPTPSSSVTGSTTYYVSQKTPEGCESQRSAINVIISEPLSVTISPSQTEICGKGILNTTALLGAIPTGGNGTYSYEWRNTGGVMPDKTTATISVNTAETYTVKAASAYCSAEKSFTLNSIFDDLTDAPSANNATVCYNEAATLTASSVYQNGSFRWYDAANGTNAISADNPYVINDLTTNKTVFVAYNKSNGITTCETPRKTVIVSVASQLSFTQQPINLTNCDGNTLTFSAANPTATSFQWQRKLPNGTWENISGETTSQLRITNVGNTTNPHLTYYRVVALNGSCLFTSDAATLFVNSVSRIATESDKTLCIGTTYTLSLGNYSIVGNVVSYQWQTRTETSGSWNDIPNAINNSLIISNLQTTNTGYYRCKITFSSSSGTCIEYNETGNGTKLTVVENSIPVISYDKILTCGTEKATLTVSNCNGLVRWSDGSSDSPIQVSEGTYTAKCVRDNCESANSNPITITSGSLPITPVISASKTSACAGEQVTLTSSTCPNGTIRWSTNAIGSTIQGIAGITYKATCITNCGTSPTSNAITISEIVNPMGGTIQAVSELNCSGYNPPEIVNTDLPSGTNNQYQWEQRSTKGDWEQISGATSISYNPPTLTDTTLYRRRAVNTCGSAYSNVDTIYIAPDPSVTISSNKTIVCSNEVFTLTATVSGGSGNCPVSWQRNDRSNAPTSSFWNTISGNTYTLPINDLANTSTAATTFYYRAIIDCQATSCNKATAEGFAVTVQPSFAVSLNISDSTICEGNSVNIVASGCGGSITWSSGQTTASILVTPSSTTTYMATCTNSCGSSTKSANINVRSGGISLPIRTTPSGVITPAMLTFSATGTNLTWYTSATGGTGTSLAPTHSLLGTYTYWVSQSDGFCESNRLKMTASVYPPLTITYQTTYKYDCKGNSEDFSVDVVGAGTIRYQWQRKRPNETNFSDLTYDGDGISYAYGRDLRVSAVGNDNNPHLSKYRCIVRDSLSVMTSQEMTLYVNSLTGTFSNVGACIDGIYDENIKNRFVITGDVVAYQWQKRPGTSGPWEDLSDDARFTGSKTERLRINALAYSDGVYYRCAVKFNTGGLECTENTDPSRLDVSGYPPAPTGFGVDYCQYEKASRLVYQSNPDNDILWYTSENQQFGSKTAPTPITDIPGNFNFFVSEVTTQGCESPKSKITIKVYPQPSAPVNTTPTFVKQGTTPLIFTANGTNLKWFTSRTGRTFSTESPTYTTPKTYSHYVSQTSQYSCESERTLISSTIRQALAFKKTPILQADCDGNSVSFDADADGWGEVSYQWQKKSPTASNFVNIISETSKRLTISNVGEGENLNGTLYRCLIRDLEDTLVSTPVPLIVNKLSGSIPNVTACEGSILKLDSSKINIEGFVNGYEWQRQNGSSWETINTNSKWLDLGIADATKQADYRLKVTFKVNEKTSCNRYTSETKVVVNKRPNPIATATYNACKTSNFTPIILPSDKKNSILWYKSATDSIATTSSSSIINKNLNIQQLYVSEKATNGCESVRTSITLNLLPSPNKPFIDSMLTSCQFSEHTSLKAISPHKMLWSKTTPDDFQEGSPSIETQVIGTTNYYVAALDSNGCLSSPQRISSVVQPCIIGKSDLPTNECFSVTKTNVKGTEWVYFYSNSGKLLAAINPQNQDLGTVSLNFKLLNENEVFTKNNVELFSRYFNFSSTKTESFSSPISIRLFALNQEIKNFGSERNYTIVHYEGVNEDCTPTNNDNFLGGKSVVIFENVVLKSYGENSSYWEFKSQHFSEFGITQNKFAELESKLMVSGSTVTIEWKAKEVKNPLRYIIERSADGKTWYKWQRVEHGNETNIIDKQPFSNTLFYRVIFQDKDGTLKYFPKIEAKLQDENRFCSVFPNPVLSDNSVQVFTRNIQPEGFEVYDVAFRKWGVVTQQTEPNTYILTLSSTLSQGTYFIRITDKAENTCTVRFVKR